MFSFYSEHTLPKFIMKKNKSHLRIRAILNMKTLITLLQEHHACGWIHQGTHLSPVIVQVSACPHIHLPSSDMDSSSVMWDHLLQFFFLKLPLSKLWCSYLRKLRVMVS